MVKTLQALAFIISIVIINSCNPDSGFRFTRPCDYHLGIHELLVSSWDAIPYYCKSELVFIDSTGNKEYFSIEESSIFPGEGQMFKYDVNAPGDTVAYCYISERKPFKIRNDRLGILLYLSLKAVPYAPDPTAYLISDVLEILYQDISQNSNSLYNEFLTTVDVRTFPGPAGNAYYPSLIFNGREFKDVQKSDLYGSRLMLYFNETEGIVAFRDRTNNLWRFERMN